jgi:hypothetical protein
LSEVRPAGSREKIIAADERRFTPIGNILSYRRSSAFIGGSNVFRSPAMSCSFDRRIFGHLVEIVEGEAEIGKNFLHGNAASLFRAIFPLTAIAICNILIADCNENSISSCRPRGGR